jgi:peptidoglycan/xylan/chitin deacetylase (PgdA/CDA1 family)
MPGDLAAMPFVLMYHSVACRKNDPYQVTVSPRRFGEQMRWLAHRGLRGVSMRELLAADGGGARRMVGLTFDDGYADFATDVVPVLLRHGFSATVFAVAGKLGRHNDWDHDGPIKALMTADSLRQVADLGIEIGSHGLNHLSLPQIGSDVLAAETRRSKEILESLLGTPVRGFCYPYGHVSERVAAAVAVAGYDYAVATWASAWRDRRALPRTYVGERDRSSRLLVKTVRHRLTWGRP